MSSKKESWEGSGKAYGVEFKSKYSKEQPMFPYGCKYCNR